MRSSLPRARSRIVRGVAAALKPAAGKGAPKLQGTFAIRTRVIASRLLAAVWAPRSKKNKEAGLAFNAPLQGVAVPADLGDFASDLKAMHKLS